MTWLRFSGFGAISSGSRPFLLAFALGVTACATASGDVAGGELRFDASPPPQGDGGLILCIAQHADGGSSEVDAAPADSTWTGLYADFFGGTAKGGCGIKSGCHGAPNEAGSVASSYTCPPTDKNACFTSITSSDAQLIDTSDPQSSKLFLVLRKINGGGKMPRDPSCSFSDADMARVTAWMRAGAKND